MLSLHNSASDEADPNEPLLPSNEAEPPWANDHLDMLIHPHAMEGDIDQDLGDLDWLNAFPFDHSQQALFWTEWAHELDTLGT